MKALAALLLLLPGLAWAKSYEVSDAGDFSPAGYRVEFADRYAWKSYRVDFRFGLDPQARALSRGSKLKLKIERLDGRRWSYTCKSRGRDPMAANVNYLYGKGISVVVTCAIRPRDFAKSVGLYPEDVGLPRLVFEALIQDGKASLGPQRGLYFLATPDLGSSDVAAYVSPPDATNFAVLFRSGGAGP